MVSHDLKNPINAGILAVKLLENKTLSPLNPYQEEILENIFTSLKYMKNLIENILDRYKFNNNAYKLNKVSVDFSIFVNSVLDRAKYIFLDKSQTLRLSNSLNNNIVEIDLLEIERVISNLLSNSCRYSPSGSEITICLFEKGENICFSIENLGAGIQNPCSVFDKFVTNNDNSKTLATGLGLYIVKEIITAHQGEVFIESEVNKFTRVTFILPRK